MHIEKAEFGFLKNASIRGSIPVIRRLENSGTDDVSISVHENYVPASFQKILDELYGSLFSSLSHLDIYESLNNASSYIAVKGDEAMAALIFRRDGHEVTVINEAFSIGKDEVARFARHIFSVYPTVWKVEFKAISTEAGETGYAVQRFPVTSHIIVPLPSTEEEYLARLGKSTRKNIKHHLSRLKRAFPSFSHEVQQGESIVEEDLLAIIELNRMRMAEKHTKFGLDQEAIVRIIKLAKRCGFISVIRIEGRICAGAICYETGKTITSHVNSHHPEFNQYRLGTLSCYLAICESIRRQAKEINLEWGGEEYKYSLLGVDRPFEQVLIYRSNLQLLSDAKTLLQISASNQLKSARSWLITQSKKDNHFSKRLNSCISLAKRRKYSD